MKKVFIIFGYGIPKNVMTDDNYNRYLSAAFNQIFDTADPNSTIIFCGGKTDCYPPYKRTEANEMLKLFRSIANRKFVKAKTKAWQYLTETRSLSRLENMLYAQEFLLKNKLTTAEIFIFSEHTREKRAKLLTKKIFKGLRARVVNIDFDMSYNRYLDKSFLDKKEAKQMKRALRATKDKKELLKYHQNHVDKLKFFRENDYINKPEVVEAWWKQDKDVN